MAKVMRKEARHTQRQDQASAVPLEILEHLPPKPESAYFLLCALTYTSDFTGGTTALNLHRENQALCRHVGYAVSHTDSFCSTDTYAHLKSATVS